MLFTGYQEDTPLLLKPLLHIPFDKYSLYALRNCVSDACRSTVGRIRKDVTMKFVDSEAKYDALMALASEIIEEAGVPSQGVTLDPVHQLKAGLITPPSMRRVGLNDVRCSAALRGRY
jgi:hypothetical protein